MEEKKDLWELVRKKIEKSSIPESLELTENEIVQAIENESLNVENDDNGKPPIGSEVDSVETIVSTEEVKFLNQ